MWVSPKGMSEQDAGRGTGDTDVGRETEVNRMGQLPVTLSGYYTELNTEWQETAGWGQGPAVPSAIACNRCGTASRRSHPQANLRPGEPRNCQSTCPQHAPNMQTSPLVFFFFFAPPQSQAEPRSPIPGCFREQLTDQPSRQTSLANPPRFMPSRSEVTSATSVIAYSATSSLKLSCLHTGQEGRGGSAHCTLQAQDI